MNACNMLPHMHAVFLTRLHTFRITRSRSRQPSLPAVAMVVSAAASLVAVNEGELQEGGVASEDKTRMSPAASITRSLRSISRAVTATVSGIASSQSPPHLTPVRNIIVSQLGRERKSLKICLKWMNALGWSCPS